MIDWGRVVELRDEIGADGFAEVVDLFLEEVEEVVARLREPAGRARLEEDLHFLKGCAWNLGFAGFGALCLEGERLAARGQGQAVDVPALLQSYDLSQAAFLEGLARRVAASAA